jgi:hypothetical protein
MNIIGLDISLRTPKFAPHANGVAVECPSRVGATTISKRFDGRVWVDPGPASRAHCKASYRRPADGRPVRCREVLVHITPEPVPTGQA